MTKRLTLPGENEMYRALVEKDSTYEGIFFAAIRTTGIFCRPSCRARKPKRENVEFFATARAALQHGYRPCKVCRPMQPADAPPAWLADLLKEVQGRQGYRWRDADLRERDLDPSRVRRWFKRHHGMTFHAYLRSLRINRAFGTIRQGDKVIEAAYQQGYESLSGFAESFRKNTGFNPSESTRRRLIAITRLSTPLGPMLAGATEDGICLLEFCDRRMLETQLQRLGQYLDAEMLPGKHPHFETLEKQLQEYFTGQRHTFDLPLVLPGTAFQRQAWSVLQTIPYGQTRSYAEQAAAIGRPRAVRAVARANGDNRLAILVPCHRVVGSDGRLTGYGGGLWRKRFLLELEGGI